MSYLRDFNPAELCLFGNAGGGTVWDFAWQNGSFEVEFRSDGFNHFVCNSYPEHSHWIMSEDDIKIFWGKFGTYVLKIDPVSSTMSGCKEGEPTNWRKATLLRSLGTEALTAPEHDHDHEHVHTDACKHDH